MPNIENQALNKLYYSIGEVAELLHVNASLLRFWEKEFNLAVSKKNKKGNRLYTVKEIEKIQRIYQFVKVEGYTLEGAKKALKSKVNHSAQVIEVNELIEENQSKQNLVSSSANQSKSKTDCSCFLLKTKAKLKLKVRPKKAKFFKRLSMIRLQLSKLLPHQKLLRQNPKLHHALNQQATKVLRFLIFN